MALKYPKISFVISVGMTLSLLGCSTIISEPKIPGTTIYEIPDSKKKITTFTQETVSSFSAQSSEEITHSQTQKIPILMFHYISQTDQKENPIGYNLSTDPVLFEKILKHLSAQKYRTIHVAELLKNHVPERSIILTFDDGYTDFYTNAWALLKKYNFTASVAVITDKMDGKQYMTPIQIQELHQNGIEILSHSVSHADLNKSTHQQQEIEGSKRILEKLIQKPVTGFVYPSGKYNINTIQLLKNAGYKIALTTKSGYADISEELFELQRIRIDNHVSMKTIEKELPVFED